MEAFAIEMTDDGLLSIPADVRQRLNLKPGKKLILQVDDGVDINPFTGLPHESYVGIEEAVRRDVALYGSDGRTSDDWMRELREGDWK